MTRGRCVAPLALSIALVAGLARGQDALPPPAPAAAAEPVRDERAVEILTAAREALESAKTVTMTSSSAIEATSGPLQAFKLSADGTVWARKSEQGQWERSMVGQADEIGTSGQISFTVVVDGQDASWIDHKKQEVVHATGRRVQGTVMGYTELLGVQFILERPYANELNAPKLEHLGTESVEGTLCDVVRVEYGGRLLPMRWYLSAEDRFPRRIVEELMEGATRTYDFREVRLDAEIEPGRFEIEVPASYAVVDLTAQRETAARPGADGPVVSRPGNPTGPVYGSDVGDLAAPVTGEDVFGNVYNTEEYLGKPVVLFFWASWLPAANETVEDIIAVHDHLGDKGKVLAMAIRERQPENAANVLLDLDRDDVAVVTSSGRVGGAFNIAHVPVVIILDAEGRVAYRNEEYKLEETVKEVLSKLDTMTGE